MGVTAENLAEKYSITREQCDEFAVVSNERWKDGMLYFSFTVANKIMITNFLQARIVKKISQLFTVGAIGVISVFIITQSVRTIVWVLCQHHRKCELPRSYEANSLPAIICQSAQSLAGTSVSIITLQSSPTSNHQLYKGKLLQTDWWRKLVLMRVGRYIMISPTHHYVAWHPESLCGAHRQDYTVACLNYTLQTMMPLPGWPVMAPNAYDNSDGTIYRIVSNIAIVRSYRGISLSR